MLEGEKWNPSGWEGFEGLRGLKRGLFKGSRTRVQVVSCLIGDE
jgi:hypothetical protein